MASSPAQRAALRRYYARHRARILRAQADYQRRARASQSQARARDTDRWRRRFKEAMRAVGYPGRDGDGLSPEGYRWRENNGLDVPPWPELKDSAKSRRLRPH